MKRKLTLILAITLIFSTATFLVPNLGMAEDKPIVMKFGHSSDPSEDAWFHRYANKFKELMETYSEGKITVEIYPSSQLGDEQEMFSSCSLGTLDATLGAATNYVNYAPTMGFLTLPYIFESAEQSRSVISEMMPWLQEQSVSESNTRLIGISDALFRELSTKQPVNSLEDIKGMVIRVPSNPIMVACYEVWGAIPTVVAWTETYSALQQGVAVGQDNPYNALISAKLYEVQKYVTDISYLIQANVFVLSEDFYQNLTPELQAVVDRVGKEVVEFANKNTDDGTAQDKAKLEGLGITFLGIPVDKDKWIELGRSVWPKFYETLGKGDAEKGKLLIETVEKYKEQYNAGL